MTSQNSDLFHRIFIFKKAKNVVIQKLLRPNQTVGFRRIWSDSVGFGRIRSDLVGVGRIRPDFVGFGRIWPDLVGFGWIWSDFDLWSDLVGLCVIMLDSVRFG